MALQKKVTCSCGRCWTTRKPALLIECRDCGENGVLAFDLTAHRRDTHSSGIVIWSGPMGDDTRRRFYLVSYPGGGVSCSVR